MLKLAKFHQISLKLLNFRNFALFHLFRVLGAPVTFFRESAHPVRRTRDPRTGSGAACGGTEEPAAARNPASANSLSLSFFAGPVPESSGGDSPRPAGETVGIRRSPKCKVLRKSIKARPGNDDLVTL